MLRRVVEVNATREALLGDKPYPARLECGHFVWIEIADPLPTRILLGEKLIDCPHCGKEGEKG